MSRILQEEAALYSTAWAMGGYGDFSPGERHAEIFSELVPRPATVLDAGCGSGKGAAALLARGYHVAACDLTLDGVEDLLDLAQRIPITTACLWHDLSQVAYMAKAYNPTLFSGRGFDWAFCCDVMEHIEPQFTMLVVQQLLNIVQRGVFFSIALVPDQFGFFAGEPLHKTVQSFDWWKQSLGELGQVVDARDLGNTGTYLVMAQ
jgi:SAM-dependent methyltransferase